MDMNFCAQSNFGGPVFNFTHGANGPVQYQEGQYPVFHGYPGLHYMYPSQQRNELMTDRSGPNDGKTESKPRLSKEEVEKLEKVFQENPKPSSSVKAQLADGLGLERPRINNWFQNRRAKAKQERKQEEYEARRAAEKTTSGPSSGESSPVDLSDLGDEGTPQHMPPSASFPNFGNQAAFNDFEEDAAGDAEDSATPQSLQSGSHDGTMQAQRAELPQISIPFSQPAQNGVQHPYAPFVMPRQNPVERLEREALAVGNYESMSSPEEQTGNHYVTMMGEGLAVIPTPFFPANPIIEEPAEDEAFEQDDHETTSNGSVKTEQSTPATSQGILTPVDSFKSPPPPANIATRRNMQRPAALQSVSLRSRSYNLGGPKTSLDSPRKADPCSPGTAMRRIASATGNLPGRVQKSSVGPRSPMFFSRNPETLLQYSRSPVGSISAAFGAPTPPTPMTPAIMNQVGRREPAVTSTCSDDEAYILGAPMSSGFLHADNLKTPPGTPGMMSSFGIHPFTGQPYHTGVDFSADQPILTPYFQSEFPEISLRQVPSYVELSDSSLPSTPLYPNMMNAMREATSVPDAGMVTAQQSYDWDANESVTSSKSSPGQARSKLIQFTQNMTPQDYTC